MVSDRSGGDGTGPRLACIDMAGTCITDEGLVLSAFERALVRLGVPADATAMEYVRSTMGQSKIEVFTALLGNAELGRQCTVAFEEEYAANAHAAALIPGTRETFTALRAAGCAIYLTTGFSAVTRDLLITGLGLADLIDGALSPQDTAFGRGRPHADMIWTAVMATGTSAMAEVLVAGDTTSDMESGHRSGARHVIGVLTGTHDRTALSGAGATVVVDSIADIPALL